jgi:zinc protease
MDRVTPPSFKKSLTFDLPPPERFSLSGDTELIYLPSSLSQAVKIEFVFNAGRIYEPALGVVQFVSQLLDKGIPGKSASQIAALLDYFGAHLESQAGFDFISVSLYCLKKDVKQLLPLFIGLLTEATFPEDELETYRRIFIENLKVNLQKNSFLASNEIRKSLFGIHPYGLNVSVHHAEGIDVTQLRSYFGSYFSPHKIFVVGDLAESDLSLLKNFTYPIKSNRTSPENHSYNNASTRKDIDGPNKTQASIRLGKPTISRKHRDIAGLTLINHILGGFFGSRLMKNIREEKGLTYGIYSGIQHLNQASWLTISADVNADKVGEAISEIKKELGALASFSDPEELELCKNHLIGSLQNDTATIFSVGERIKTMCLSELGLDFYGKLISAISLTTVEDIQRIAASHLPVREISIVAVK